MLQKQPFIASILKILYFIYLFFVDFSWLNFYHRCLVLAGYVLKLTDVSPVPTGVS